MEPNITPPPAFPTSTPPRTSPSAVWSLVLGILSLACFSIITGIPAVICGHVALGKIKRAGGALAGSGLAIAGLITGYISIALSVIILPLMLAIAVPNFVKARNTVMQNACITNLRQLEGAKQQWALENQKPQDSIVTFDNILPYVKTQPVCPSGGTYQLGRVSEKPTCSVPGHVLPKDQ